MLMRLCFFNDQANPLPLGHRAIKPCRASVSGSPTEEVEEAAALLAYEAQGLGEPVRTPYEPPESSASRLPIGERTGLNELQLLGSLWLRFLTLIQGLWLTAVRLVPGS